MRRMPFMAAIGAALMLASLAPDMPSVPGMRDRRYGPSSSPRSYFRPRRARRKKWKLAQIDHPKMPADVRDKLTKAAEKRARKAQKRR